MPEENEAVEAYAWSWWRPAVLALAMTADVLETVSRAAEQAAVMFAAAHNHQIDQEDFRRAVVLDIESIWTEE